jgi:hypothetical protein
MYTHGVIDNVCAFTSASRGADSCQNLSPRSHLPLPPTADCQSAIRVGTTHRFTSLRSRCRLPSRHRSSLCRTGDATCMQEWHACVLHARVACVRIAYKRVMRVYLSRCSGAILRSLSYHCDLAVTHRLGNASKHNAARVMLTILRPYSPHLRA